MTKEKMKEIAKAIMDGRHCVEGLRLHIALDKSLTDTNSYTDNNTNNTNTHTNKNNNER